MQNQTAERKNVVSFTTKAYGITALFSAVIFLLIIDRLFKALASAGLGRRSIIGDWLAFDLAKNSGIAFSLPFSGFWLYILIGLIIIGLVAYLIFLIKKTAWWQAAFFSAIILGAASNLFDRLKYGVVIDYLDLRYFTVFNLADVLIVAGAAGLLWFNIDRNSQVC